MCAMAIPVPCTAIGPPAALICVGLPRDVVPEEWETAQQELSVEAVFFRELATANAVA